jgi:hypothetical protein
MILVSRACTPVTGVITTGNWSPVGTTNKVECMNTFDRSKYLALPLTEQPPNSLELLLTDIVPKDVQTIAIELGVDATRVRWGIDLWTLGIVVSTEEGVGHVLALVPVIEDTTGHNTVSTTIDTSTSQHTPGWTPNRFFVYLTAMNSSEEGIVQVYGLKMTSTYTLPITGTTTYTYGLFPPNINREDLGTKHEDFIESRLARDSRRRGPDMQPKRSFPL